MIVNLKLMCLVWLNLTLQLKKLCYVFNEPLTLCISKTQYFRTHIHIIPFFILILGTRTKMFQLYF